MTAEPAFTIPVGQMRVPVGNYQLGRLPDGEVAMWAEGGHEDWITVRHDLWLRQFRALDISDPLELLAFQCRYGALGGVIERWVPEEQVAEYEAEADGFGDGFRRCPRPSSLEALHEATHAVARFLLGELVPVYGSEDHEELSSAFTSIGVGVGEFSSPTLGLEGDPWIVTGPRLRYTSLEEALYAQMWNHLVRNRGLLTCSHCGEPFTTQEGKATGSFQRSRGVLYCSQKCAQNARMQRHRQRKKGAGT